MAIYTATVTTNNDPPAIQAFMVGSLSYLDFVNALSALVYKVKQIFLEAQSNKQILEPLSYNQIDSNGNAYANNLKPRIDPYQYRSSLLQKADNFEVVLNGLSSLSFNLLPGEMVGISLCTDRKSFFDALDAVSKNNFKRIDDNLGNLELFENYKDCF